MFIMVCARQTEQVREAEQILNAADVKGGLIIHLGCGDGTLTAALRTNDSYLVHGLDVNVKNVEKARRHIRSLGMYGKVSVEQWTETARVQRDWRTNVTILSGDIGIPGDSRDNSYHVVTGTDDAVIDGFTITGGNGMRKGRQRPRGSIGQQSGMNPQSVRRSGQIHITPNTILSGANWGQGAGMLNYQCASVVKNCIFRGHRAMKGGGMYNMASKGFRPTDRQVPAPKVTNCTFIGNYASARGGAVSNDLGTHTTFTDCNFLNNSTGGKGGGMYNDFGCSPTVTNCVFTGNSAFRAGAIGNDGGSSPMITNCTFTGNYADDLGAALYQGTGPSNNPIVTNCIIWGNIAPNGHKGISNWHEYNPSVTYSCVEGGYIGEGNIDADPLFVDEKNGDYRLSPGSPCIDAGNGSAAPEADIDGNPRYDDNGKPNGTAAAAQSLGFSRSDRTSGSRRPLSDEAGFRSVIAAPPVDMGAYERQTDTKVPAQDVVYVDVDNVAGLSDGKSWTTAYRNLQEGLDHGLCSRSRSMGCQRDL